MWIMVKLAKFALISIIASVIIVPTNFANAEAPVAPIAEEHVQDEVIIGYFDNGSPAENEAVRGNSYKAISAVTRARISPQITNTEVLKIGKGVSVEAAIARLKNQPGIRFVEPNYIVHSMATSNDPLFTNGSLWGMYGGTSSPANQFGSNAANSWTSGYVGSSNVVIGVIDEGIQITHPDLEANIWINPGEIARDGLDNDNNNYVDDINGWDFVNNDSTVYDGGTTASVDSHGTHVSGTIGGKGGNAAGIAGVNWNVKIISTKFLGANGGSTSNAVKALDYLTNLKSRVNSVNLVASNNSWGGGGFSQALLDAINRSGDAGMLFIAAAGNSTSNNDTTASYPSNYSCTTPSRPSDCVIAVAAISSTGGIASFSSYGLTTVDLGAPGVGVNSTLPYNTYGSYSGTSMATPHVTGAVALCKSIFPSITSVQLRSALLSTVTPTSSLTSKTVTNGRLNVGAMATNCANLNTSLQNQASLLISNTIITEPAGTPIPLTASGGSGSGLISFITTGQYCAILNESITVTAPTSCSVSAIREASGTYKAVTSPAVDFIFTSVSQSPALVIETSNSGFFSKGNTGITLQTSGGAGTGAVTYAASPASCVIKSNKLTVAKSVSGNVSCSVTATKAASGIYASATSPVKVFIFK